MCSIFRSHSQSIHLLYSLLSFFKSSIHYIHIVYYVQTYILIYKINFSSFWLAESFFLLWNCLNDLLIGWFSDRYISSISHRMDYLTKSSILFCLTSLLFWYPFIDINSSLLGLQLFLSLCFYDTCLTIIDLNYNSLLIDINDQKRETLSTASTIGNAFGAFPLLISYLFWSETDLRLFRIFVTILTILIMCGFIIVSQIMKQILCCYNISSSQKNISRKHMPNLWQYLYGIHKQMNCIIFSLVNIIQVFHCHFNSKTIPIILNMFIPSSSLGSILLGISFLLPHITNIYFVTLCKPHRTYYVIRCLFYIKFMFMVYLFIHGKHSIWLISLFLISNRIFTEGICKLFDLIITDLIDEDQYIHRRIFPLSTLIFGTMTFLSKPGQTFASIISSSQLYFSFDNFLLILIMCSLCQIILWNKFKLNNHLIFKHFII